MKNLRFWLRFISTYWRRFQKLVFLSSIIGVVAFILIPRLEPLFSNFNDGERVGVVGRYTVDGIPLKIQSRISLGLTQVDEAGKAIPELAVSWNPEEDGKVWIFKIGAFKWQDGSKVTARDINYKFSDAITEVVDDQTVKFVLKDPYAPFPTVVSRPVFKKGFMGIGDWRVNRVVFFSNSNYVRSIKLKNIKSSAIETYKFYLTENDAKTGLKLGEIDDLEMTNEGELSNWKNLKIDLQTKEDRYIGIFINTQDPLLSDKNVRQALAYAIDKTAFSNERAISPISPQSWAFNPQVKQYNYSPDHARELLKDLPKEQKNNLSVKLVTTPTLLPIADKIKVYWDVIGVKTQIQVSNSPPENFQTLLAIQAIPPDPDQYSFWHSSQTATNITRYGSAEGDQKPKESQRIDKLLEDGRRTLDPEERKRIYLDFQRFLLEDSPVIFLYHPTSYSVSRKHTPIYEN